MLIIVSKFILFCFFLIQHPQLSASYVESIHVNIEFLLNQAIKGELSNLFLRSFYLPKPCRGKSKLN